MKWTSPKFNLAAIPMKTFSIYENNNSCLADRLLWEMENELRIVCLPLPVFTLPKANRLNWLRFSHNVDRFQQNKRILYTEMEK